MPPSPPKPSWLRQVTGSVRAPAKAVRAAAKAFRAASGCPWPWCSRASWASVRATAKVALVSGFETQVPVS